MRTVTLPFAFPLESAEILRRRSRILTRLCAQDEGFCAIPVQGIGEETLSGMLRLYDDIFLDGYLSRVMRCLRVTLSARLTSSAGKFLCTRGAFKQIKSAEIRMSGDFLTRLDEGPFQLNGLSVATPQEGEDGVTWPELGTVRGERLLEVSCGVATVDLPARVRSLSQEMLYAVRMAIANTLTEFSEISYVNVLIGGREEGLDLGATLPVGTFTRVDDLDVGARYSRLYEQRQSSSGVTLLTTLYFPAADSALLLPEVRSIAYAQVSPIEYLYTLLGELGKGASLALCAQDVPAPMDYIEEMPEIVRTEDGYLAIELRLSEALGPALEAAGIAQETYMAMLTDTLMGFVPGVEGLRVLIGGETAASLLTRSDFEGCVGAPATLYVMDGEGLSRVQRVLPQALANDARTRLAALMRLGEEELFALPDGLTQEDILAVHMGDETIAVNLSARFGDALAGLAHAQERAAVYAMVNTLTEGARASRVAFFFEGEQVQTLAGGLEMRGTFLRNPGMVVN